MTGKIEIVRELGEEALLLPALLSDALAANERIKLRLSLLQAAAAHALQPGETPRSFEVERRAVGLADARYDSVVSGARALSGDKAMVPGANALMTGLASDLAAMLAPLDAAGEARSRPLDERMAALVSSLPKAEGDELSLHDIGAIVSARRDGADSVHLLVMDAHKAINQLAAETAVETIDGAFVHHVEARDRRLIKAFMAGLNRTAGLAFGHPGLATTATRIGAHLTIQNDIGTTDAHVLVIHVEDSGVTVTYTDVHRARAKFFIAMFEDRGVEWSPLEEQSVKGLAEDDVFYLVNGRFAGGEEALARFLEFLGSRIVFLIDWNKARKALQTFVGKDVAIGILTYAAVHDFGHRAFLELGGIDLVFEAVRRTAAGRIPYGARLDETLGAQECATFLKRVLRQTSEGLSGGRSVRLIRDEVQADLAQLFDTAETAVLAVVLRHLGVTRMLASTLIEAIAEERLELSSDRLRLVSGAKRMEEKADRLTVEAREICARVQRGEKLRLAVDEVENATDSLDECAFLLSLLPRSDGMAGASVLTQLADIVIESISHLVRATEAATHLPQGNRADAEDALRAIDSVIVAERKADGLERDAFSAFMAKPADDARSLVLGLEVARSLETATDHLAHAALALRDRVLEDLSA